MLRTKVVQMVMKHEKIVLCVASITPVQYTTIDASTIMSFVKIQGAIHEMATRNNKNVTKQLSIAFVKVQIRSFPFHNTVYCLDTLTTCSDNIITISIMEKPYVLIVTLLTSPW